MIHWIFEGALTVLALGSIATAQSGASPVGTWRLLSSRDTNEKGETKDSYGAHPTGFLTYTAEGRMIVLITTEGRKPLSIADWVKAPAEERAEAYATCIAYAGRYSLSGDEVIHHVEASTVQNFVNTDFVRYIMKLDGDRLILRTTPLLKGGEAETQDLVWERVKPGQ